MDIGPIHYNLFPQVKFLFPLAHWEVGHLQSGLRLPTEDTLENPPCDAQLLVPAQRK
jgi:hypothetical protein